MSICAFSLRSQSQNAPAEADGTERPKKLFDDERIVKTTEAAVDVVEEVRADGQQSDDEGAENKENEDDSEVRHICSRTPSIVIS